MAERMTDCWACGGSGGGPERALFCRTCKGTGSLPDYQDDDEEDHEDEGEPIED
jgi:DnaJ-class molecular chaperone